MEKQKTKRKPLPPHWYKTYINECPLCGRGQTERVRMFTPAPAKDDFIARYDYAQVYDWCDAY